MGGSRRGRRRCALAGSILAVGGGVAVAAPANAAPAEHFEESVGREHQLHRHANNGNAQGTFTAHLNIISQGGGVVDRVAQTGHFGSNGEFTLDKGTCMLPE